MKNNSKIKEILEKREDIIFALVFGSVAQGRQTVLSDVDVGIYMVSDISLPEIGMITFELEKALKTRVDLVVLNEIYKKSPLVAFNIIKEGKLLFCRDNKVFIDFKRDTFRYYLDAKYLIDLTNRAMLKRIKEGRFGVAGDA